MEQELKLLKEREVEQKNTASGYETLLKDGIPLNEHFIALKNKFNQEKDEEERKLERLTEDTKYEEGQNREKSRRIRIKKEEFDIINNEHERTKSKIGQRQSELEKEIAKEQHLIETLKREREHDSVQLKDVEGNNITLDRELQKERMFNPREQDGKDRVLDQKEREEEIERLNKEIIAIDTTATHEDMRFKDPNLIE